MSHSKRVLVVGDTTPNPDHAAFDAELQRRGYDIRHSDAKTAANLWAATRSDVVILDLLAATAAGERDVFLSLAQRLQRSGLSDHRPVIALADSNAGATLDETVDHVDDVLYAPLTAAELVSRVDALHRLTTMQSELARRITTAAKFGLDVPQIVPPADIDDANILIVGDPAAFRALEGALAAHTVPVGAFTGETALDYLSRRAFDAVVVTMDDDDAIEFVRSVRRNPVHCNLPIIVHASGGDERSVSALYDAGATDVATGDPAHTSLPLRMAALVREHRFRKRLSAVYRDELRQVTCDALTGLYSRGFLMDHLAALIDDAERWSDPLTLAAFAIGNISDINKQCGYAAGDLIIKQVGEIIAHLVRGEDVAVRWSGARFVTVFTATEAAAATAAISRIRAVIRNSEFAQDIVEQPLSVDLWTAMSSFTPGDTAETLVERVIDDL